MANPQLQKNPKTGEVGYWITIKGGKRVFVSADRLKKRGLRDEDGERGEREEGPVVEALEKIGTVIGALVAGYAGYRGVKFAKTSISSARYSYLAHRKTGTEALNLMWENRRNIANQLVFPFRSLAKAKIITEPTAVFPYINKRYGEAMYYQYDLYPRSILQYARRKKIGWVGFSINQKESYVLPQVFMTKQAKGKYAQNLKAIFNDTYAMAMNHKLKNIKVYTSETGGYAWARAGFDFENSLEREKALRASAKWADHPSIPKLGGKTATGQRIKHWEDIKLTPAQRKEVLGMFAKAETATEMANLVYTHPEHGPIKIGKEVLTDLNYAATVDLSTMNPGHALLRQWLGLAPPSPRNRTYPWGPGVYVDEAGNPIPSKERVFRDRVEAARRKREELQKMQNELSKMWPPEKKRPPEGT